MRLRGEMQYANEHSLSHAQTRIREAASRHGEVALIVAGLLPPPNKVCLKTSNSPFGRTPRGYGRPLTAVSPRAAVQEPDPMDPVPDEDEPPPLPVLSEIKLQSYYYLRTLEIRESKRRILMNLNFFTSVGRTLAKMAERHNGPINREVDFVQVDYDNYDLTDDGVPLVRDVYGVNILHESSLVDMEGVQERMLKLGTHFIAIARGRHQGDQELLYIDTMGVMADLYGCEASYQEAKRATVERYFEALQHVSSQRFFACRCCVCTAHVAVFLFSTPPQHPRTLAGSRSRPAARFLRPHRRADELPAAAQHGGGLLHRGVRRRGRLRQLPRRAAEAHHCKSSAPTVTNRYRSALCSKLLKRESLRNRRAIRSRRNGCTSPTFRAAPRLARISWWTRSASASTCSSCQRAWQSAYSTSIPAW